jgi:methylmalonyl-CoA mutase
MGDRHQLQNPVRVVTAASLFDGHDAAINVMRRILQAGGAEVIHLGHNRSAADVVTAAIHEDAQAVAISSYQGGHVEYFRYVRQLLDERGGAHIKVFGGGGGVIVPEEIRALEASGIERIYSPEDGRQMGLVGMIDDLLRRADFDPVEVAPLDEEALARGDVAALARAITRLERAVDDAAVSEQGLVDRLRAEAGRRRVPVLGITGTGGAGKSSLTDELLLRYLRDQQGDRVAVLSIDPTRKRSGGALLGDRIRMNAIDPDRVFMRSLATRRQKGELSAAVRDAIVACQAAGFDLVIVETSGIGQGDADIVELVDVSLYVMTPEFGAPSQLEKIDMLDFADLVAINKFEKKGAMDALRDVRKQVQRNRELWSVDPESLPVYGTNASRFADEGVDALYHGLLDAIASKTGVAKVSQIPVPPRRFGAERGTMIAPGREHYLGDISRSIRAYHAQTEGLAVAARRRQRLQETLAEVEGTPAAAVLSEKLAEVEMEPDLRVQLDG